MGGREEQDRRVDALLAGLDRDRLQSLVMHLVQRDPNLIAIIEKDLRGSPETAAGCQPRRVALPDLNAVRRQMTVSLHHPLVRTDRGWYIFHLGHEATELLEQAWNLIRSGEGRGAMDMLNAMTDECLQDWQSIMEDEEGETLSFVTDELGPAWTEAILVADLTPNERDGWEARLDAWESELADYVGSESFEAALKALKEGWDDPDLRRILRGEVPQREVGALEPYPDVVRDHLTIARLNVLERQGRYDEYLNLARAEGQVARYTTMLVRRGQAAMAADYGVAHLQRTDDALILARELREAHRMEEAVRVAEHGLDLDGRKAPLGTWLADLAAGLGNRDLAFQAATVAFLEERSLASYLRLRELAGDEWKTRREEFLVRLRGPQGYDIQGPVDIFLHEGLIENAIALVDRSSYPLPTLIRLVADAAIEANPDWVIRACRKQAEAIMDAGKSGAYGEAADWLARAKRAYLIAGRDEEWQGYLADLLEQHHRKYKLVPLLQALGGAR